MDLLYLDKKIFYSSITPTVQCREASPSFFRFVVSLCVRCCVVSLLPVPLLALYMHVLVWKCMRWHIYQVSVVALFVILFDFFLHYLWIIFFLLIFMYSLFAIACRSRFWCLVPDGFWCAEMLGGAFLLRQWKLSRATWCGWQRLLIVPYWRRKVFWPHWSEFWAWLTSVWVSAITHYFKWEFRYTYGNIWKQVEKSKYQLPFGYEWSNVGFISVID